MRELTQASALRRLSRWLLLGEWRAHPVRALVAIAAIAVGVALGFAIHLVNAAALNEFSAAVQTLSGQADVQVSGTEPFIDESIYPRLAERPGVGMASPILTFDASLPGRGQPLRIIGLDAFRAASVSPGLIGTPNGDSPYDTVADDAVFLSPAAGEWLGAHPGDQLDFQSGTQRLQLRVAGTLSGARAGQRLGVMDIGAAQWRFRQLGKLSRVDLRLRSGEDRAAFRAALLQELERDYPGRFRVTSPNDGEQNSRSGNVSRAYRVNLTVLALVALFTGAFLVFTTQALSVMRRRGQFALLRVLGLERRQLMRQILLEGLGLGVLGALLGIAGGYAIAAALLRLFGGDLGAGFFSGVQPQLRFTPFAALVYFGTGVGVALLGCAAPAVEASRARLAVALKSGTDEVALARLSRPWPGLACLLAAALLTQAPPLAELPIFGYLSIALMLIGAIALMPRLSGMVFRAAQARWRTRRTVPALALARLANASSQAGIALGGVLSSFSLMVAMAIMVASFRVSVDDWVQQLLPADLYVRTAASGSTALLTPSEQDALRATPGIARTEFLRARPVSLSAERPNVLLLARDIDPERIGHALVLSGPVAPLPAGSALPQAWVSEAMVDLYGLHAGATLKLPLAGRPQEFHIAGVWRDYARSTGAVIIFRNDYIRLTGDREAGDAAVWLAPGASAEQVQSALRALPFGGLLEMTAPGEIRQRTLTVFDRSFAVTYLLEAIAIIIGLFGVAATFSAQTLARAKEFGMLRHVGLTRGQVLGVLAFEGGALTGLGILMGFVLGWVISLVLVHVVNPQSFHWTMEMHYPWPLLATVAGALLVSAAVTALLSGRRALSAGPIRAVREDW
jgi:putative ABC transport system permease protein